MVDFDVVAIGAGTGGLTVTRLAAAAGLRAALVERDRLGGDCLWTGCVPTKALVHAARVFHETRSGAQFGTNAENVSLDFAAVRAHVLESQQLAGQVDSPEAIAATGVELITGSARFVDPLTIEVDGRHVTARNFVIATGSKPAIPPIPGLAEGGFDTNVELVDWDELPASLAIIGGGPIGVEFAQVMARFGVEVHLLEAGDRILPRDSAGAAAVIRSVLEREGVRVLTGAKIESVSSTGATKSVAFTHDTQKQSLHCERLLVATGRTPEFDSLNVSAAGVRMEDGKIVLNKQLQTSQSHIYAVGDAASRYQFTHVAEAQARMVANVLMGKRFQQWSDRVVPRVTYTDPEVASVGLDHSQARKSHGRGVKAWRVPLSEVDRAITMGATEGFFEVVTAPGWNRRIPGLRKLMGDEIVGATLVGPGAGELLMPITIAMRARLPIGIVAWNMQAYPTLSLGLRQTVGQPFDTR
jgi:pyruvate/2-oxoglutarate dehydrogenase complex dihydrolipoamide dehydrogenase (E3) component